LLKPFWTDLHLFSAFNASTALIAPIGFSRNAALDNTGQVGSTTMITPAHPKMVNEYLTSRFPQDTAALQSQEESGIHWVTPYQLCKLWLQ
jgi:hypothetical protein